MTNTILSPGRRSRRSRISAGTVISPLLEIGTVITFIAFCLRVSRCVVLVSTADMAHQQSARSGSARRSVGQQHPSHQQRRPSPQSDRSGVETDATHQTVRVHQILGPDISHRPLICQARQLEMPRSVATCELFLAADYLTPRRGQKGCNNRQPCAAHGRLVRRQRQLCAARLGPPVDGNNRPEVQHHKRRPLDHDERQATQMDNGPVPLATFR